MLAVQSAEAEIAARRNAGTPVPLGALLASCVGSGIAHLGTSTMPFQVGALMDGAGLSASAAGVFGFCEIAALSAAMLLVAPIIHRFNVASVAFAGLLLCAAAHLILYFAPTSFATLCVLALAAGCGYGLVFAATVTAVSSYANPDRIFAVANGGALVVIVALIAALPTAASYFGQLGPFLGIAIILLVVAPAFAGFRNAVPHDLQRTDFSFRQAGVVPLLAIWTAFSLGTGAVWSFSERAGRHLDLAPEVIGAILSTSVIFGILGTAVAASAAGRIPRLAALLIGLVGTAFACLLLANAGGFVAYTAGVLLYWVFYMFLYSYLMGSAAVLDPSGRVGTAGGGFERMGFALGAPAGGYLVDHFSLGAVGWLGAVSCLGLAPVCLPRIRHALTQH